MFLFIVLGIHAQKTEATVNVQDPKGKAANGNITVTSNDTSITKTLENGSTYFLLKNNVGIPRIKGEKELKIGPNPIVNENINFYFKNYQQIKGEIEFYDITGKLLNKTKINKQEKFSFQTAQSIIIYRYLDEQGTSKTGKLVNLGKRLNVNIQKETTLKNQQLNDDYKFKYEDTEKDTETDEINKTIPEGTHEIINMITRYTLKGTATNITTNTGTRIRIRTGEKELADVNSNDGTERININERFSKYEGLPVKITLTGEYTDTATINKTLEAGILATIDTIRKAHYQLTITGNGDDYTIEHNNTQIGQGVVGAESYFKLQKDEAELELIVNGEGLITKTTYFTMNKGETTKEIILEPEITTYEHSFTYIATSSEAGEGHKVRDSPILFTNSEGTRTINTNEQTATYNWTSEQEIENVTYDFNTTGEGHENPTPKQTTVGTTKTINETITARNWTGNIEYHVVNDENNEDIEEAKITTTQNKEGTTNNTGLVTLINYLLNENQYSEPITTNITYDVTKTGYDNKNGNHDINTGENKEEIRMTTTNNPLETFYIDEGTTTRNATITIKEGTTTIGVLKADENGHISSTSFDWQLEQGKDLVLEYTATNADNENVLKTDVDDEEHISIEHLLNAYFPISISADEEVNWNANSTAGNKSGTGNGSFEIKTRANDLTINFNANANDAENYSANKTYPVGGGNHSITMNWIYTINMENTENEATITGTFETEQVYTTTGTGGTVQKTFTRTGVKNGNLQVQQNKSNFSSTDQTFNVTKGTNNVTLEEMTQLTYQIRMRGYNSSPTGTTLQFKEEGQIIMTGTVDENGDYVTNYFTVNSIPFTIDQVFADGPNGWIDETNNNIIAKNEGDNIYETNLEKEENNYEIKGRGQIIGAIINGEPNEAIDYLKEGEIRFTTKKDNTEHDISIDANGYFDGNITGPYNLTDTILIDFVNNQLVTTNTFSFLDGDQVASTGKIRNDDGSYVASANEQRFTQYNAWTTIEKLTNKNLLLITFSDEAYKLPDDLMNINQETAGIISYIEDTVIFVNDTINLSTGEPLTQQQQTEQQEAIDFLAEQLTTRTGITLANNKKIYGNNNFTNLRKKCYLYKAEGQAGNGKTGDTPNTFYASSAHTRSTEGRNLIITEGSTAQHSTYDLANGNGANCFVWDATGRITDYSWEGDVAKNTSYLFPPKFFKKE